MHAPHVPSLVDKHRRVVIVPGTQTAHATGAAATLHTDVESHVLQTWSSGKFPATLDLV